MIRFILNNQDIETDLPAGMTLLDFIRYESGLVGTKIGCREGDCGACTVLMGAISEKSVKYKSITSCITPLVNAHGKHVVTIEGLNMQELSPIQQAMVDESGSQCGFCTVGFIVSFMNECLQDRHSDYASLISAIDGNICRCTGYKSIERATKIVEKNLEEKDIKNPVSWLVNHEFIPPYFNEIRSRLLKYNSRPIKNDGKLIGGGTDLLVQDHDKIFENNLRAISDNENLIGISSDGSEILIKAATNTTQLLESEIMNKYFPKLFEHIKLVSSTPIRNIATIAGNFVNASPIGDLTIFFLALNAKLDLVNSTGHLRTVELRNFYSGYKIFDLGAEEHIEQIRLDIPHENSFFNFEKVSKRRYLDIASVNSAISLKAEGDIIQEIHASAGGVSPVPLYLKKTVGFLEGKKTSTTCHT